MKVAKVVTLIEAISACRKLRLIQKQTNNITNAIASTVSIIFSANGSYSVGMTAISALRYDMALVL
ncbi:hypothetical protein BJI46_03950 [Acinetobacter qingfengensis]|uniref:Uncharacterized protein n=1 Tax=Acinetobacter qingfengensis TaxID=1262585 RepID=A0A1E7R2T5_9GAMM|nr:hypothetical protein BJI46_03950 [Acinetobacter qingfengensis]